MPRPKFFSKKGATLCDSKKGFLIKEGKKAKGGQKGVIRKERSL
jgi:hypothetical protein